MANELVQYEGQRPAPLATAGYYMPVAKVAEAVERVNMLNAFTQQVMREGVDYGAIPGAGTKKVLLKPGAEKLASFWGLVPDFVVVRSILDFDGTEHGGEALLYYHIRCDLYRDGMKVGSGEGTCNSRESKYRWRKAERTCPNCHGAFIIKGKAEYGGGWVCFKSKGGCGSKFKDGDQSIEGQTGGRVPNPDIADLDNTLLKMAEKRALIAATLIATNVSDHFTQDLLEDDAIEGTYTEAPPAAAPVSAPKGKAKQAQEPPPANGNGDRKGVSEKTLKHLHALGVELYGGEWDSKRPALVQWASSKRVTSSKELTETEAGYLVAKLAERKAAAKPAPAVPDDVNFGMGETPFEDDDDAPVPAIHVAEQPALVQGGGKVY